MTLYLRFWICLLLASISLACGSGVAAAQTIVATVSVVTEQDDRGRWHPVDRATRAFVVRDGQEPLPIEPNMSISVGDRIETDLARIELEYATGEHINIVEGTSLTLQEERSVVQEIGEVYYRLRSAFEVQYGTVDTVVEGTRFAVAGSESGGAVAVRVDEGRVRVTNPDASVAVVRGRSVEMEQAGPLLAGPVRARPTPAAIARTHPRGRPGLVLDAAVVSELLVNPGAPVPGLADVRLAPGVRLGASVAAGSVLRLRYDTTVAAAGRAGLRLPQSLSVVAGFPGVSFGGGPSIVWERRSLECGGKARDLTVGGIVWSRKRIPIARGLAFTLEGSAGYDSLLRLGAGGGLEVSR